MTGERMAKILEFRCRETLSEGAQTAGHNGVPAEVIVFPGVRYQSWEETQCEAAELGARSEDAMGSERDRLELVE